MFYYYYYYYETEKLKLQFFVRLKNFEIESEMEMEINFFFKQLLLIRFFMSKNCRKSVTEKKLELRLYNNYYNERN